MNRAGVIRAARSNNATTVLMFCCCFFFICHEISTVSQPIVVKLCHMIRNGCNFNKKAVLSQGRLRDAL